MNARVGVTQNLVLDGTYNPDFSQIEADANRISVPVSDDRPYSGERLTVTGTTELVASGR